MNSIDEYFQQQKELTQNIIKTGAESIKSSSKIASENPFSASLAFSLGMTALLGRRGLTRVAQNMQQMINGFYGKGVGQLGKLGAFGKEALRGTIPATRQQFNQRLHRAGKEFGFSSGQKQDLDRVFEGYHKVMVNPKSWTKGTPHIGGLTESAAKEITALGKQELGIMHNAFAQLVKTKGIRKAKQSKLYDLIKNEATYEKYGIGGKGKAPKLFKDMGIDDPEVGNIALSKWKMQLPKTLKTKNINIANFRHSAMQKSAIDAQFSSQAKIAFLAHEKGLMKKGAHLDKLGRYFQKRGYGNLVSKSNNYMTLEGKTYRVSLHKTKQGSTLVNFSPSRKSNYHWGGFNGNLVFNEGKRKGKVGIFGTDVYDLTAGGLPGEKFVQFRKTPLLNVQNVKYKDVPIINKDKIPKTWVQRKPKNVKRYNRSVFNQPTKAETPQTEYSKKYGVKETQEFSPYAKERFDVLDRPTAGRVKPLKSGAIPDTRDGLGSYTRLGLEWNKNVKRFYELYTASMKRTLNPVEQAKFISLKTLLGIAGGATVAAPFYGAYKSIFDSDE